METGKIAELMLLWDIKDKIPTAQEVAKAIVEEEAKRREDEKAYWEAWDKAFIQGDIEQLRSIPEAGIQTAKALGISKEALIRGIENGEIKTFVVLEPSAMKVIPKLSFWADETREEAQTEEYKEWLKNIKELMQKYEHRIVCAHTIPHTA